MADDVLVRVENVGKKYCRSLKRSMLYGVEDIARDILHLPSRSQRLRKEEFWAVKDVSFELRRGECLGIIGPNGAGKSTLLKMLNGIILPDRGRIMVRGKVGALIEVGAGFNPMLTGRENIYISGAILGLSKKEIDKKFDEIVAFAELEEFIDTPVKHYSSGMYVRLGFAIAVQMEPDVLILDEILAVGDIRFRAKSFNALYTLLEGSAVILVSHNLPEVYRVSNSVIYLDNGECAIHSKNVMEAIGCYQKQSSGSIGNKIETELGSIDAIELNSNCKRNQCPIVEYGGSFCVLVKGKVNETVEHPDLSICFLSHDNEIIEQDSTYFKGFEIKIKNGFFFVELQIDHINLRPGSYYISVALHENKHLKVIAKDHANVMFQVVNGHYGIAHHIGLGKWNNRLALES